MTLSQQVTDLLDDSKNFLFYAKKEEREGQQKHKLMYARAVIVTSYSALEGWINYISLSFIEQKNSSLLNSCEKAFLMEKKIEIDNQGNFQITKQDKYENTTKKLQFILNKFGNYDIKSNDPQLWSDFKKFEKIRNSLVHPKHNSNDNQITLNDAEFCFNTITKIIQTLKDRIYQ